MVSKLIDIGKVDGVDDPTRLVWPHDKVTISQRSVQGFLCLLAVTVIVWSVVDPRFRDAEGLLKGNWCLPLAAGAALMILAAAVGRRFQKSAFWLSLALVGQAVALQIIDAGPLIHYQHYKTPARLITEIHPLLLALLLAQTTLVLIGLRTYWASIRGWIRRTFRIWQLVVIGLVFFLTGAAVAREIPAYVADLSFAFFIQLISLANIVLMVCSIPEEVFASLKQRFEKLFGRADVAGESRPGGIDRFAIGAAVWVTMLAAVLSFFVYERHPHIPDEVIYLYHARYLASGELTVPAPPVPEAFSIYMIPNKSQSWYSIFPPGWPAVLSLGVLVGVPWLVNPLLAGVNVLLAYLLIQELYSRRTARMVVFLLCVSPWHIFMSMNFMSHTFTLTCALAACVAMARSRRTGKAGWGWLSGLSVGLVALIRPLDGLAMAGLLGLWAVGVGGKRLKVSSITAFGLGVVLVGAISLSYNRLMTGSAMVPPLEAFYDQYYGPKTNAIGFGPERGLGWEIDAFPGHSPLEAVINANLNTFSVNIELLGWSTGSLLLMTLLLFSKRMVRSDYLMLALIVVIVGGVSLYWYSGGPDFGARYWYLILIPCIALTVRGAEFLESALRGGPGTPAANGLRVHAAVLSLCVIALVNYFPWRAVDKYHHYLGMRPDIRSLEKEYGFGKSLVLIRGNEHPDYQSAWTYNPLNTNSDSPLYAFDRSPEVRARVIKAYPDRPVWIVDGPTLTGRGFKVVEGPLPAQDLKGVENAKR